MCNGDEEEGPVQCGSPHERNQCIIVILLIHLPSCYLLSSGIRSPLLRRRQWPPRLRFFWFVFLISLSPFFSSVRRAFGVLDLAVAILLLLIS